MHDNANITFAQNETIYMLGCLLNLQPKTLTGEEKSHDEVSIPITFLSACLGLMFVILQLILPLFSFT